MVAGWQKKLETTKAHGFYLWERMRAAIGKERITYNSTRERPYLDDSLLKGTSCKFCHRDLNQGREYPSQVDCGVV
jgi:hypothetical protein